MISEIGNILLNIILPIFLILGIGVIFDRAFEPDLDTMSKLNFYILVPAVVFISIIEAELPISSLLSVAAFHVVHFFVLFRISILVFSLCPFKEKRSIMTLGTIFYNAGNFGIPFTVFAFGMGLIDVISVSMIVQNMLMFTVGLLLMEWGQATHFKEALKRLLKIPVLYALLAGIVVKWAKLSVPAQIFGPLNYIASAMVALALLTLSFKLSRVKVFKIQLTALLVIFGRLILAPLLAFLLISFFKFEEQIETMLIITSGLPAAVNTYIMAAEYKRDEDIASQVVFWTTILSAITLSILLFIFS